jgi:hypothetical protein
VNWLQTMLVKQKLQKLPLLIWWKSKIYDELVAYAESEKY